MIVKIDCPNFIVVQFKAWT